MDGTNKENISVIGLGYVGLVTALGLAGEGNLVWGMDSNQTRIDLLTRRQSPFSEPEIAQELAKDSVHERLTFTENLDLILTETTISFICVGTPLNPDTGLADLGALHTLCRNIGARLAAKNLTHIFAIRSTIPPGTMEKVVIPILEQSSGLNEGRDFHVINNPEFMREGCMWQDFQVPEVALFGGSNQRAIARVERTYGEICTRARHVWRVSSAEAELTKYAFNTFLATKISFANEMGMIGAQLGVNTSVVMEILKSDKRIAIAGSYLKPGYAFGGSCLPKDLAALAGLSQQQGYTPILLNAIMHQNDVVFLRGLELARKICGDLRGKRLIVLGAAFKKGTGDIRGSRIVSLISALLQDGAEIWVMDPNAEPALQAHFNSRISFVGRDMAAVRNCDLCILGLDYAQFGAIALYASNVLDLCDHQMAKTLRQSPTVQYTGLY